MKQSNTHHLMRRHLQTALDAAISHSMWQYRRSLIVFGNCGVCITPLFCNRVTNHGDMGIFSRPDCNNVTNSAARCSLHSFLEKVPICPWLVTLLQICRYTNSASSDITRNCAPILPETILPMSLRRFPMSPNQALISAHRMVSLLVFCDVLSTSWCYMMF